MTPLSPSDWPEYGEVALKRRRVEGVDSRVYIPRIRLSPFGDRPPYDAEVCEALGVTLDRWRIGCTADSYVPRGYSEPFPAFAVEVLRSDGASHYRTLSPRWVEPVLSYLADTSDPYRYRVERALHALPPSARDTIGFVFDSAGSEAAHAILLQLDAGCRPGR